MPHVDSIFTMNQPDGGQLETSRCSPQLDQPSCANLMHHDHRGALHLCTSLGANGLDAYLVSRVSIHMQIDQVVRLHRAIVIISPYHHLLRRQSCSCQLSPIPLYCMQVLAMLSYHDHSSLTCRKCGTCGAVSWK